MAGLARRRCQMRALSIQSLLILSGIVILGGTILVHGQGVAPYYAAVGPGSYHHASTVEEGAQRGMADVIRSSGAANLMNSEAAINLGVAQSQYIDNRMKATTTYFDMKAVNKQARYGNRKPHDPQQAIRLNKERLPDRLNVRQVDPVTGAIRWPLGLTLDQLNSDRKKVDKLFADRAENGYLDLKQYNGLRQLTDHMTGVLQKHSRELSSTHRIEAKKFLESLTYEAGFEAT